MNTQKYRNIVKTAYGDRILNIGDVVDGAESYLHGFIIFLHNGWWKTERDWFIAVNENRF